MIAVLLAAVVVMVGSEAATLVVAALPVPTDER
jgi:hypothetical protein